MSLGNFAIVAAVAWAVLMVFLVKWWMFDDKTDRLRNHGEPIPTSRLPHPHWPGRGRLSRKAAGGGRRLNRGWSGRRSSPDLELSSETTD
jgi:hypothetical protein